MTTVVAPTRTERVRAAFSPKEWRRLGVMFGFVVLLHVVGWGGLILAATRHYNLGGGKVLGIGTGVLAYTL